MSKKKTNNKPPRQRGIKLWIEGARLRTLPLAVSPIAIGAGAAAAAKSFDLGLTMLALAVAMFLQIGVNFANDYSDGIRGTDDNRVGPLRLTGSKSVRPQAVKFAAFTFFGLAALAGLAIVLLTQHWWFIPVGIASILAAWFYTGGKSPYGYAGLGEIAVFIFFGLVATYGTAYIQIGRFDLNALLGGTAAGLFASAVLMVNNIRDIDTDRHVGKRTLAVKVGKKWAKAIYLAMLWLPLVILAPYPFIYPVTIFAWASVLLVLPATLIVLTARTPKELILALKLTSFASLGYAILFGIGLAAL
ncbi:1,4-dihydroxy-2-naphthoate polyprenyltransferase [Rhodoluna lacicola]|uniref:1,4-dihydroxy-2-naphthoate polyprenyltransferase n=1 Tax=Rhodoluna lacicola TaxID=529884 RepID=UPI00222E8A35|nr:1,4-dihydroxy-2-naphthoate polyprenyltransferase [Rhodoluna lacicola]BDS49937.1 1,4-dihydroxy-2-naphthoate octaprenyltransferase [Rhodoluna lacicola]